MLALPVVGLWRRSSGRWPGRAVSHIDYCARQYDPVVGRWFAQDPLSEKYYGISPYAFCNNNPVNFVDPDGEDVWEINSNGIITWVEESDEHRL